MPFGGSCGILASVEIFYNFNSQQVTDRKGSFQMEEKTRIVLADAAEDFRHIMAELIAGEESQL